MGHWFWLTGNSHLARHWPFGRVTEGLPTIHAVADTGFQGSPVTREEPCMAVWRSQHLFIWAR